MGASSRPRSRRPRHGNRVRRGGELSRSGSRSPRLTGPNAARSTPRRTRHRLASAPASAGRDGLAGRARPATTGCPVCEDARARLHGVSRRASDRRGSPRSAHRLRAAPRSPRDDRPRSGDRRRAVGHRRNGRGKARPHGARRATPAAGAAALTVPGRAGPSPATTGRGSREGTRRPAVLPRKAGRDTAGGPTGPRAIGGVRHARSEAAVRHTGLAAAAAWA